MKEIINEIYSSKLEYDKKCIENKIPNVTMEQHMFNFFSKKYGLKNLVNEWIINIEMAIKIYSILFYFLMDIYLSNIIVNIH